MCDHTFSAGQIQGNDSLRFLSNEELKKMWQSVDNDDDGEAVWLSKVSGGGVIWVLYGMVGSYMGGLCLPASSDHLNILPLPPACARAKFQTFFILSKTGNVSKTPIYSALGTCPNLVL